MVPEGDPYPSKRCLLVYKSTSGALKQFLLNPTLLSSTCGLPLDVRTNPLCKTTMSDSTTG